MVNAETGMHARAFNHSASSNIAGANTFRS
jgi:hypothetical protein